MIGIIGDSLTWQGGKGVGWIRAAFERAGRDPELIINGLVGRGIAGSAAGESSLEVVRRWRVGGVDPDTYVIALGTNNKGAPYTWFREIGKVLAEIGPGKTVHWIGLGFRDPFDGRPHIFQATLEELGDVLIPHDWARHIHDRPQDGLWLATDEAGVHNDPRWLPGPQRLPRGVRDRMSVPYSSLSGGRMSRQRAQYLRRAIPRLRFKDRRCPQCRRGVLDTEQLDVSTIADLGRGQRVTVDGRTVCDRCGFDATSLQSR